MKKLPKVAIVGFPNVGKSTLFNRLLNKKRSLVHFLPGMTRDSISAPCQIRDACFMLFDTGGFLKSEEDPFSFKVQEKAWQVSREADILLFVLDGKREFLPAEKELYSCLRKLNKSLFIVVNKMDSPSEEIKSGDYYSVGGEVVIAVSAEHKRNLGELQEKLYSVLPGVPEKGEKAEPLRIALVGRTNVGKSSLVNFLCGHEKLIVSEIPGTTRDSIDTMIFRNKKTFCLVDTAGIRKLSRTRDKREKASIIKARKDIAQADVICLVMDAMEFPTRQDTAIARIAFDSGKPLLLALNKWDQVPKDSAESQEYAVRVYRKLEFVSYAPLLFVSALTGKKVVKILDKAEEVFSSGKKKIPTPRLNEFLIWVNAHHPPVSKGKGNVKIKYMTQQKVSPPTFLLFTPSSLTFSSSYEKFFIHLLREKFGFFGNPIRIHLRRNV